jgi:hypothetical protein
LHRTLDQTGRGLRVPPFRSSHERTGRRMFLLLTSRLVDVGVALDRCIKENATGREGATRTCTDVARASR